MQYFDALFIYSISCSALLVYGIGLEKVFFLARPGSTFTRSIPILLVSSLLSVAFLWFMLTRVLLPYDLVALAPMTVILVCGIVQGFVRLILPESANEGAGERLFFFGVVFLAVYDAYSFLDAVTIVVACVISFSLFTVILFAIRERLATGHTHVDWKGAPLVLITMGLLFIALYAADVSWWVVEVFR